MARWCNFHLYFQTRTSKLSSRLLGEGVFMCLKKLSEYLFLWTLGGILYCACELTFRGFTHWSMFILGGLCLLFFWLQGQWCNWRDPMWLQVIRCTIFVTACEFITGIIVNKWLHWAVWDYSDQPLQLFGQICLPFATFFSGLSALGIIFSGNMMHWFYREKKPNYHVL